MLKESKLFRFLTHNKLLNPVKFSSWMGRMSARKMPHFLLTPLLKLYIHHYNIDMSQFDLDLGKVKTFNEFFTRKLKPGSRTFAGKLLSPADSILTDFGAVNEDIILEVKGMECSLNELFFGNDHCSFNSFAVFYLSPADYHRFHAPFDFEIEKIAYVPGKLHSVKPKKLDSYSDLYCLNRRVIIYGNSAHGKFALIFVGALVVGRIILNFFKVSNRRNYQLDIISKSITKGEELGYFELGSTVILLMESNILSGIIKEKGEHVLVGENLIDQESMTNYELKITN
ncbi:MAG: phosphatidylserine decarboxylase [Saprospiraceae bacterium]|nr:phosphatidylserine decarboxylase [Saprospiraceae bacterium]